MTADAGIEVANSVVFLMCVMISLKVALVRKQRLHMLEEEFLPCACPGRGKRYRSGA